MLVECVPNFSEGRDRDTINTIVNSIRNGGAVHILDVHSDVDHNRTVVTFAGPPQEVLTAMFEGIRTAAEFINLDQHEGQHPRFGAADVVPFIPLEGITMDECVQMAHRLGEHVGSQLGIPVYMFGHAATRPERRRLSDIRKHSFQYEQLRDAIETNPDHMPDYGPARVGPAGATLIGARKTLIAYNVYLTISDVEVARRIADAIRESGGGMVGVRALGLLANGKAQVSMNLTDYERTPVHRAVEFVRREAQRYGAGILSSELVGLIPQDAVTDSAAWYLQLEDFSSDRILENRLALSQQKVSLLGIEEPPIPDGSTRLVPHAEFDEHTRPTAFVESVAQATPSPGGGSSAALVGALAAALTQMSAAVSYNKTDNPDTESVMQAILVATDELRDKLLDSIIKDVVAVNELMAIYRLPKNSPKREKHVQQKLVNAAEAPLQVARMALQILQLGQKVILSGNRVILADALTGVHLARATIDSTIFIAKINLREIHDRVYVRRVLDELAKIQQHAYHIHRDITEIAEELAGDD
ncbi:MAG: glutamate formimidoyltransferase [Chloroflexi bacterium]|nr:glutamate formimidoyltransferase [Chloroflexota bacterium]